MNRPCMLAAACLATLAATGFAQTNATLSLQVGGKTRSCVIHVPAGVDKPAVVFFVHGANGSGANFRNETKGDVTADREKFIAAYPSASGTGATGTWEDMQGTGNFPFFLAVLDTLDARYKIDRNRIYMTGFSQGGFISFAAGCFYSNVFAAVAPVSGHAMSPCTIKRPVPVFMTWGAQEGTSFLKDRDIWTKLNNCPAAGTMTKPYPASNANSKAVRVSYGPCDQGSSVVLDSIVGQGHQWPGASNLVQADEVWAFFKQYTLQSATGALPRDLAAGRSRITATYGAGFVRLEGMGADGRVEVADAQGRLVAVAATRGNRFAFKGRPSGVYTVTLRGNDGIRTEKFLVP